MAQLRALESQRNNIEPVELQVCIKINKLTRKHSYLYHICAFCVCKHAFIQIEYAICQLPTHIHALTCRLLEYEILYFYSNFNILIKKYQKWSTNIILSIYRQMVHVLFWYWYKYNMKINILLFTKKTHCTFDLCALFYFPNISIWTYAILFSSLSYHITATCLTCWTFKLLICPQ